MDPRRGLLVCIRVCAGPHLLFFPARDGQTRLLKNNAEAKTKNNAPPAVRSIGPGVYKPQIPLAASALAKRRSEEVPELLP
jgi:hypothetical protein